MSMWEETNKRLRKQELRRNPKRKAGRWFNTRRTGMNQGTERIITRETKDADGKTVRRRTIVPKSRSRYAPKPGEPVGKAKPRRNHGQAA